MSARSPLPLLALLVALPWASAPARAADPVPGMSLGAPPGTVPPSSLSAPASSAAVARPTAVATPNAAAAAAASAAENVVTRSDSDRESRRKLEQVEASKDNMLKVRDPFRRVVLKAFGPLISELEQFSTEEFRMLGMITGPDRMKAMLAGPNGKTYFVTERQRIGKRKGVIARITPEFVRVKERVQNVLGREENVEIDIRLPSDAKKELPLNPAAGGTGSGW